jgi:hypothetical protein
VGKNDLVAQLVEQYTFNVRVARSSRAGITIAPLAQLVERLPYMQDVGGSNPSGCTKEQVPVSHKDVPENRLSARSMKQMIRVGKLRSGWMN